MGCYKGETDEEGCQAEHGDDGVDALMVFCIVSLLLVAFFLLLVVVFLEDFLYMFAFVWE